jgi:hypothetical protein
MSYIPKRKIPEPVLAHLAFSDSMQIGTVRYDREG